MADREDIIEANLIKALNKVENKITALIATLDTSRGQLITTNVNLRRALAMRTEILKAMAPYNRAARNATDYSFAVKEVRDRLKAAGIKSSITNVDKDLIDAFSADVYTELRSSGTRYAADISNKVYTNVIAGAPLNDTINDVKQLLTGGLDRAGRPLETHAKTIATTKYREIDSTLIKKKATEAGITKFKYVGSLIKDSRDFCAKRAGKTYTLEEIESWNDLEWQGKKSGDVFITRGGWNCRHNWGPVAE